GADIIISATLSPHYTFKTVAYTAQLLKPRVLVDLAVPRDIEDGIATLPQQTVLDLDSLKQVADENQDKRQDEAQKATAILEEYMLQFHKWYTFRKVVPLIQEIREMTRDVAQKEIDSTIDQLKGTTACDKDRVRKSMVSIVKNITNRYLYDIRDNGTVEDIEAYLRCLHHTMSTVSGKE
ncbi:MAG: hypothetical protein H7Y41_06955, partial [Hyphomonadaceae bacterium]|nr:hypothetical protein [Clostridia bacterium]